MPARQALLLLPSLPPSSPQASHMLFSHQPHKNTLHRQEDAHTKMPALCFIPSLPPSLLSLLLTNGYQGRVQEEEDTHGDEEKAQAQQPHADLLVVVQHGSMLLLNVVMMEELCVLAYSVYVLRLV